MPNKTENPAANLLRKEWGAEIVHQFIGHFKKSYFAYASNENIRENAASGGVATALLTYLLDSKQINGALVCRSIVNGGKIRPEFIIARDNATLLSSQGSKYMAVDFTQDALPLIKSFEGRLAVVLLPCDTSTLRRVMANDPALGEKIALVITLFCGTRCSGMRTGCGFGCEERFARRSISS